MTSYPAGITMSNRALITLSDALRQRRTQRGTRWRRLNTGTQALLVIAHLRKGETYTDLRLTDRSCPQNPDSASATARAS